MSRIETLIGRMTLAEKLGQLTMTACRLCRDRARSSPAIRPRPSRPAPSAICSIWSARNTCARCSALAVKESRLGIPLLIGLDVVHGHRILFPIPLGEASSFDPEAWALTRARVGQGSRGRRTGHDLCTDAGCGARSALGPHRRRPGRRSLARRAHRRGEGARIPGCQSRRSGRARRGRQALLRLWRGDGGPRLCLGRHLRANAARGPHAAVRRGGAARAWRPSCRHSPISRVFP